MGGGNLDLFQDWALRRTNTLFERDVLERRCNGLLAQLGAEQLAGLDGRLERVENNYKNWAHWNGIMATGVRMAGALFAAPAILVICVAVGLVQVGVIVYTTWDHLDSPEGWPLRSFAPSVIEALR